MHPLTPKQEQFCLEYAKKGKLTGSDIYRKIYNVKTARAGSNGAVKLLAKDYIQKRINQLRKRAERATIYTVVQQQEYLMGLLIDQDATVTERTNIIKLLGQYQGAFTKKIEQETRHKFDFAEARRLIAESKKRNV